MTNRARMGDIMELLGGDLCEVAAISTDGAAVCFPAGAPLFISEYEENERFQQKPDKRYWKQLS